MCQVDIKLATPDIFLLLLQSFSALNKYLMFLFGCGSEEVFWVLVAQGMLFNPKRGVAADIEDLIME